MTCPHCHKPISDKLVTSAAARLNALKGRGKSGRPASTERCPCGLMTADRAAKRGHQCEAPSD